MTPVYQILDVVIVAAAAIAARIAFAGGGIVQLAGVRFSATSALNPLEAALLLSAFRARFGPPAFLWIHRLDLQRGASAALAWWRRRHDNLACLTSGRAAVWVLVIAASSLAIKLYNADAHFGFWTGDDVEIQEMTISKLFAAAWPVWNLRCAFYPMIFIYPAQAFLKWAGAGEVQTLVFGSRVVVALWSTLDVWLTYRVGARVFRSVPIGLLAAIILAFSKLHVMAGSSELPRVVSTAFVLLAFGWLNGEPDDLRGLLLAGVALGIASAMRFSEEIFLIPAMFQLVRQARWRDVLLLPGMVAVAALVAIGVSDWAYWGHPFFSLRNIVDFTLVQRQSSRGFQPVYEYLVHVGAWSNVLTVALALFAIRLGRWTIAWWTWLPVLVLSLLPHKEPRYLIPILPFLSLSAAVGLWHVMAALRGADERRDADRSNVARWSAALFLALVAAFVWESAGFRFVRSEAAVRLAQYLGRRADVEGLAVEQLWRMGGRLYFPPRITLLELDPSRTGDPAYVTDVLSNRNVQWTAIDVNDRRPDRALADAGFHEVSVPAEAEGARYRLFRRND
jgi:hypothetical protein